MSSLAQLADALAQAGPLRAINARGDYFELEWHESATTEQRTAGQAILDAWDWDAAPTTWHMPASEFQTLLTDDELTAIQTSLDPNVIRLRTWIQTIRDDVQSEDVRLIGGINYLAYVAGLLTTPRAARILAGLEPE